MTVSVLGVRHHGPGSARAVREELRRLRPDAILVEGPPEADPLVALAPELEPPVALLAHVPGAPSSAAFWPFARFSPEWQAILYGTAHGVPVRFCDLPAAHSLVDPAPGTVPAVPGDAGATPVEVRVDPIATLAFAAGYDDPERWWEDVVEHRGDTPFEAIAEAMAAVREGYVPDQREARREAYMRRILRAALKEGHQRIAVVCGAWHVPALTGPLPPVKADDALLRGLPKAKVELTWVPWTYGRLAWWSGYGAGIGSPGWYDHLFAAPDRPVERWLAAAAGVLRDEGLPVSSAHVIEATRLAHGLATLRGRPLAGLGEVTEAVRAVLCEGDEPAVELIQRRMVVGDRLGHVTDHTPMVPLQRDLRDQQRRLRFKPEAIDRDVTLDLRKPLDLERSHLLHRLRLLGVGWGTPGESRGKGTFKETWRLRWRPEFDVTLIESAALGVTVAEAATQRARDLASGGGASPGGWSASGGGPGPGSGSRPGSGSGAGSGAGSGVVVSLADLADLVERCLLAELPDALPEVLAALSARAALDIDVTRLMAALPAMARAHRYGDVRGTPAEGLAVIVRSMLDRVRVGLPAAVTGLDDEAAAALLGHIDAVHAVVALLEAPDAPPGGAASGDRSGDAGTPGVRGRWLRTLRSLSERPGLHGLIEGRLTRILLDAGELDDAAERMSRAMSSGHPPARAAAWVEGFLAGGGLLLVHDARLLELVDGWLTGLSGDQFTGVLPLLRRTFGGFAVPERRAIGERVRSAGRHERRTERDVDERRAAPAVATVLTIIGRSGTGRGDLDRGGTGGDGTEGDGTGGAGGGGTGGSRVGSGTGSGHG
ncbi:DUF5682 family protein [Nonomuraea sp. 3-1Str]|uniref:DUF5682 family protein n=1 Tax=Nonomuraea sp. 3-1Str TaxID=2929801 RepID=UPI00285AEEDE|nr:DUF5682 family protein [Nonomuraea sp. 3-1Str]MDR8414473.1 DUF5682 family protein [Nonomuraea sp. 3-1Str]